jgi:small-conductance mechanosensitive channel
MREVFTKIWASFLKKLRAELSSYNFSEISQRLRRLLTLIFIIWLALFLLFYVCIPTKVQLPKARKDAAVVLTGGANRIDMGFRLLESQLVKNLFISGVAKSNKQKNFTYYFEKYGIEDKARVKLGYYAQNTEDNAIETKLYLQLKIMKISIL